MKKRVKIPKRNPKALLDLITKVRAKHLADGETSPLNVLNWIVLNPLIEQALQTEDLALKYKRETLNLYQQRAIAMVAITEAIRSSRDVLAGVHRDKMKMLGQWGFDVLDTKVTMPKAIDEANRHWPLNKLQPLLVYYFDGPFREVRIKRCEKEMVCGSCSISAFCRTLDLDRPYTGRPFFVS